MKGLLRLEIEKLQCGVVDSERSFETRGINSDWAGHQDASEATFTKCPSYKNDGRPNAGLGSHSSDKIELDQNGTITHGLTDSTTNDVSISIVLF